MTWLRKRITYANVMATIAVFLALGGVSYAAFKLPKNSVGSKQLKREAVNGAKVKLGTIPGDAIRGGALSKAEGDARYLGGTIVVSKTISGPIKANEFKTGKVECPSGYQAIGGGVDPKNVFSAKVSVSAPLIGGEEPELKPDGQYGASNGWFGAVTTQGGGEIPGVVLQVICAPIG
ncbi:MAG: hypothetical protein U0R71_09470 [Solirubrobacterales bacterium]